MHWVPAHRLLPFSARCCLAPCLPALTTAARRAALRAWITDATAPRCTILTATLCYNTATCLPPARGTWDTVHCLVLPRLIATATAFLLRLLGACLRLHLLTTSAVWVHLPRHRAVLPHRVGPATAPAASYCRATLPPGTTHRRFLSISVLPALTPPAPATRFVLLDGFCHHACHFSHLHSTAGGRTCLGAQLPSAGRRILGYIAPSACQRVLRTSRALRTIEQDCALPACACTAPLPSMRSYASPATLFLLITLPAAVPTPDAGSASARVTA